MISKKLKIYVLAMASIYLGSMGINSSFASTPKEEGDDASSKASVYIGSPTNTFISSPGEEEFYDVDKHIERGFPQLSISGDQPKVGVGSVATTASQSLSEEWRPSLQALASTTIPTGFLLGEYLERSKTFAVIRYVLEQLGIKAQYLPYQLPLREGVIDEESLDKFMRTFLTNPALQNICVSNPYKGSLWKYVTKTTEMARRTNAINFVYKEGDVVMGDNRDGIAFLTGAQEEGFTFSGEPMVFFGCGGVASAVAVQLALEGRLGKVGLIDPEEARRETLASTLKPLGVEVELLPFNGIRDFSQYHIFYNATGLGKAGGKEYLSPLNDGDILPTTGIAIDANYTPWETLFLRQFAARGGFRLLNGFSHMLNSSANHVSLMAGVGREISHGEFISLLQRNSSLWRELRPE